MTSVPTQGHLTIDENLDHPRGCWKLPGHHACAIAQVQALRNDNLVAAFQERGKMIQNLTKKLRQRAPRRARG